MCVSRTRGLGLGLQEPQVPLIGRPLGRLVCRNVEDSPHFFLICLPRGLSWNLGGGQECGEWAAGLTHSSYSSGKTQ